MDPNAGRLETPAEFVARWRDAGPALAALREAELAALTPEESRIAAFDMLQLAGLLAPDPVREASSGFVEMQRLFARGHARGRA